MATYDKEYDVPEYEYDEDEGNEEDKQNAAGANKLQYTGVHSAGFKDLLLKP